MKKLLTIIMALMLVFVSSLSVAAEERVEIIGEATALVEEDVARGPVVKCPACGGQMKEVTEWTSSTTDNVSCTHKPYGYDTVTYRYGNVYSRCSSCGYEKFLRSTTSTSTVCHGHY